MLISQRPTLIEEVLAENRSKFVIEPLEPGFGYTLGNSLRRTLLSSIPGAAVTSIKIDGVLHEFTTINGIKENVSEIILNVKQLVVSSEHDEPVARLEPAARPQAVAVERGADEAPGGPGRRVREDVAHRLRVDRLHGEVGGADAAGRHGGHRPAPASAHGWDRGRVAADGAAALNAWLAERSGIAALRHALTAATGRFAVLHRAHRILARLDQLAFTHPARDHIRTLTAGLRADPALAAVTVLEDYQRMLDVDPDAAVTDELRTILTATTPAGRVGLDGHPPQAAVAAEAHRRLAAAQQRTLATRSAAEDAALVTLIRTYTALAAGH